jgi:hypothetical protein
LIQWFSIDVDNRTEIRKFNLPYFFDQKAFFTSLIQQVSRKTGISMEKLNPRLRVMRQGEEMMEVKMAQITNSYYIEGLWLNGARWVAKHNSIDEMLNGYESSTKLPMVHLVIEKHDSSKLGDIHSSKGVASSLGKGNLKSNLLGRIGNSAINLVSKGK